MPLKSSHATAACVFAAVAFSVFLISFRQTGTPRSAPTSDIRAIRPKALVSQTMSLGADGFYGVTIRAHPAIGRAGTVVFELIEVMRGKERRVAETTESVVAVTGQHSYRFSFAPIQRSRGHRYRFTIRVANGPGLVLESTADDTYRDGVMFLDGQEQWGDLVFETNATDASLAGRALRLMGFFPSTKTLALFGVLLVPYAAATASLLILLLAQAQSRYGLQSSSRFDRISIAALGAMWAVVFAILWRHATDYFFLFDDFALVSAASSHSLTEIFSSALFGFYRPLPFAVTKVMAQAFGWHQPAAYAGVAFALHAFNSFLVCLLARSAGLGRSPAFWAAGVFGVSPWASEVYFWQSAVFDLLATGGVLVSLVALVTTVKRARTPAVLLSGVGVLVVGGITAFFSKEAAIILPLLGVAMLLFAHRHAPVTVAGSLMGISALFAVGAVYLWARGQILPGLGGAYGDMSTLMKGASVWNNLGTHLRAFAAVPFPADQKAASLVLLALLKWPFLLAVLPALIFGAVRRDLPFAVVSVAAMLVSLVPVLWIGSGYLNTAGGRFLYLPGVWFSLLLASGLEGLTANRKSPRMRSATGAIIVAIGIGLGYWVASVQYQARLWATATRLSRSAVHQLGARVHDTAPRHLLNLPYQCAEGPYILKTYAFRMYYAGRPVPPLRADGRIVTCSTTPPALVGTIKDPFSEYDSAAVDEHSFYFNLQAIDTEFR